MLSDPARDVQQLTMEEEEEEEEEVEVLQEGEILGKRKRASDDDLEWTIRQRGKEIALLEKLISNTPEIVEPVMYHLPYPTIRNFCAVSKTIAEFCGQFLDDAFWRAMWLSDRRVFTVNEQALLTDSADVLLRGDGVGEDLWRTLRLPDSVRGEKLEPLSRSPRAHVWARYEAVLLDPELQEVLLTRLDGTWRHHDQSFPLTPNGSPKVDTELHIAVLSDGKNGTVRGTAWWDDMGEDDLVISDRFLRSAGQREAPLGNRVVQRNSFYPALRIRRGPMTRRAGSRTAGNILIGSWLDTKWKLVNVLGAMAVEIYASYAADPGGAPVHQPEPGQDEFAPAWEMSNRFLLSVYEKPEHSPRLLVYALPTAKIHPAFDYDGGDGLAVIEKKHAIVLFDGKDYRLRPRNPNQHPPEFFTYGDGQGRPALIKRRFDAVHHPKDPRESRPTVLSLVSSVLLQVELERNAHRLDECPPTLPYDTNPDTYQVWTKYVSWTVAAFRMNILTDRVLQERFVDAGDRARRHALERRRVFAFADVARIPHEDTQRYMLRRITPAGGERPYEVIWDRQLGFPFCHHRGLPVGAFAERFLTEHDPSFCPENACKRAHVSSPRNKSRWENEPFAV